MQKVRILLCFRFYKTAGCAVENVLNYSVFQQPGFVTLKGSQIFYVFQNLLYKTWISLLVSRILLHNVGWKTLTGSRLIFYRHALLFVLLVLRTVRRGECLDVRERREWKIAKNHNLSICTSLHIIWMRYMWNIARIEDIINVFGIRS